MLRFSGTRKAAFAAAAIALLTALPAIGPCAAAQEEKAQEEAKPAAEAPAAAETPAQDAAPAEAQAPPADSGEAAPAASEQAPDEQAERSRHGGRRAAAFWFILPRR